MFKMVTVDSEHYQHHTVTVVNIIQCCLFCERIFAGKLCVEKENMLKIVGYGRSSVVYNSSDEEVFGIACCHYANLVWFTIGYVASM